MKYEEANNLEKNGQKINNNKNIRENKMKNTQKTNYSQ